MGYYEEKKKELETLLSLVRDQKTFFESAARQERSRLDENIAWVKKLEEGVIQMAKERQIGFPWLAKAYDELFNLQEKELVNFLNTKQHPATSSAEVIKEQSRLRRKAEKEKKIAQYIIEYYENIAPFLVDLKEELDIATERERELLREYSDEELYCSSSGGFGLAC